MKLIINIPNEWDETHQNEIAYLIKLICDNIDCSGIECERIETSQIKSSPVKEGGVHS